MPHQITVAISNDPNCQLAPCILPSSLSFKCPNVNLQKASIHRRSSRVIEL